MNIESATSPLDALHTPAVTLAPLPSLLDPVQRIWDTAGCSGRSILLHAFNAPCDFAAMNWNELHYTVQIVLRAYMQCFIKSVQVPS